MDAAVQRRAADLRRAAVCLDGLAPLLPAHEIQYQGLAPVACGQGEWRGRTKGPSMARPPGERTSSTTPAIFLNLSMTALSAPLAVPSHTASLVLVVTFQLKEVKGR